MHEETRSVVVAVPAEALWDYLSDYDRVVRLGWEEASARPIRASFRCRTRYAVTTRWEGILRKYVACLQDAEPPRTLTWSTRDGLSKSWVRFDLRPSGPAHTEVDVTLHFNAGFVARGFEEVSWELLLPALTKTLSGLRRLGNGEPATATRS